MDSTLVYLGLGSNLGDSQSLLNQALDKIKNIPTVNELKVSRFFRTTPVSEIPQDLYINAVCSFKTNLEPFSLLEHLQSIEKELGKKTIQKNGPRLIDLDILFFGNLYINQNGLEIPHPRWKERLFVLMPLLDLTTTIMIPDQANKQPLEIDLKKYLEKFSNKHHETVIPL
jgi:2-amino-4-hydroxy-6-hydroxymethyldihydropteridine diphosphokinase